MMTNNDPTLPRPDGIISFEADDPELSMADIVCDSPQGFAIALLSEIEGITYFGGDNTLSANVISRVGLLDDFGIKGVGLAFEMEDGATFQLHVVQTAEGNYDEDDGYVGEDDVEEDSDEEEDEDSEDEAEDDIF